MGHITGPHMIDFIGTLGGAIGMSIGLYFQMVCRKRIHPGAVLGFFTVGMVIFLLSIEPFTQQVAVVLWLRAVAYLMFIVFEVAAAWWVWDAADVESPYDAVVHALTEDEKWE